MPTDAELKSFLEKDGDFNCPPITESTRATLIKRYNEKKTKEVKSSTGHAAIMSRKTFKVGGSRTLLDYSSAEDEHAGGGPSSQGTSGRFQKRISVTARNTRLSASTGDGVDGFVNGRLASTAGETGKMKSALLNYSEGEDGEDDDIGGGGKQEKREHRRGRGYREQKHVEDDIYADDDDDDDDDYEDDGKDNDDLVKDEGELFEDDDDDDEEEGEDDGGDMERMDIGAQTSTSSDVSSPILPGINSDALRRRRKDIGNGSDSQDSRFSSITPLSPVRRTSSYAHPRSPVGAAGTATTGPAPTSTALPTGRVLSPVAGGTPHFPLSSATLRKTIGSKDFGSLGEALATLPGPLPPPSASTTQSPPSPPHSSTPYRPTASILRLPGFANGRNNFVTQAALSEDFTNASSSSSLDASAASSSKLSSHGRAGSSILSATGDSRNSHLISKLIITVVIAFFGFVLLKYSSLRPSVDITHRLPLCGAAGNEDLTCVDEGERDRVALLFKDVVAILDEQGVDYLCKGHSSASVGSENMTQRRYLTWQAVLARLADKNKDTGDFAIVRETFETLSKLVAENPAWGIRLVPGEGDSAVEISFDYPSLDWSCWIAQRMQLGYMWAKAVAVYILTGAVLIGFIYAMYKLYIWQKERRLQEHQEVFELVEQVLSLLVTQKHAEQNRTSRGGGGEHHRPTFVPVNYIRDQLIPPQDRKRKKKIWENVVRYVRDSESRVREDVTQVCGEEHRVWQWMPDIHWNPAAVSPGLPNPFVPLPPLPPQHFPPASAGRSLQPTPQSAPTTLGSISQGGCGLPPTPTSQQPALWQGSAFSALNRNVASPAVAPTSCLKVRNLLTKKSGRGDSIGSAWMWQVKEEVLRRCCSAQNSPSIVHIAVDMQSTEGCVYIKCLTSDDAGRVFRTLHGQWYRGELVSVKYLREERYHERFPDARYQVSALKPQST